MKFSPSTYMIQLDFILLLCSLKGFIFVTSPVIVCQLAISFRNSCLKNKQQKTKMTEKT